MSNAVPVIMPAEAVKIIASHPDFYTLVKKKEKEGAKPTKCKYLNVTWKTLDGKASNMQLFGIQDVPLSAIKDPAARTGAEADCKPQLTSSVSRMGDFGTFIMAAQKLWPGKVEEQIAAGNLSKGKKLKNLVQLTISEESQVNPGGLLDDPKFRWTISEPTEKFPENYPISSLANKPKTQIFDYSTGRVVNGKAVYDLATVDGPGGKRVPVDFSNIHKFVTAGSKLVYGRFTMSSVAGSAHYNSMQVHMNYAIIEKGRPQEIDDAIPMPAPASSAVPPAFTNAPVNNNNDNNAPAQAPITSASEADIAAMLEGV